MEDDLEITRELTDRFICDLTDQNIRVTAISGAWGPEFVDLLPRVQGDENKQAATMILASETIYALPTLKPFTETLVSIMRTALKDGASASGLVAVKQIYFGVGGGVEDFVRELRRNGGESEILWEKEGVGMGRVILEVKMRLGLAF